MLNIESLPESLQAKLKGKEEELEKAVLELRDYAKKDLGETVTELEEAAMMHYKDVLERKVKTGLETANMTSFKAGAKWQFENIEHKLLTEVLPCFMSGGEADEVVAKLEEVLKVYE